MSAVQPPQVLFFDTFGTVVEWRTCVTNALRLAAKQALDDPSKDLPVDVRQRAASLSESDWQSLAQDWRSSYGRGIRELFNDDELWDLTLSWHRLNPWPDSVAGLDLLNTKFTTSTLSNGNMSLLEDLKKYGHLPFNQLVSSENFRAYKPSPIVYHGAADLLEHTPAQCALVAAHLSDLKAAKGCGFQTIYVERELEEAWSSDRIAQAKAEGFVDIWVGLNEGGFVEAARRLGITA
ncbi:uncharacterized protein N7483_004730 [Penicillium malachiteum]|uniref:uncharacterized protein n=1 Tax=Penicillium malachiteum TaxID=1324776 RepID=UPI0025467630|nr:uncharacterized protein N7483_004730 [Penicillium malachiteum]KAJ5730222.1 hypothetical protein N7483_004730 [Penicillium malachiteum]